jgi:hypothetical protein
MVSEVLAPGCCEWAMVCGAAELGDGTLSRFSAKSCKMKLCSCGFLQIPAVTRNVSTPQQHSCGFIMSPAAHQGFHVWLYSCAAAGVAPHDMWQPS